MLIPPPDMLPSVWAESNIHVPVGNAIPGPINFDNAPMQRGMLDAIKEPGMRRMDLMLGAQLGKTTFLQCAAGYFIAHEPKSQIMAQPSEGDKDTFLETKLKPMLEANKAIANKMAKPRGRSGVNNSRMISYAGGWLMFSWAGSPKTARGRSAPVIHADEIDGYDATKEGDFLELLSQRAATFGDDRLELRSSTPVELETSRIYKGWLAGDQRRYYVKCPDCGELQYMRWEQVHWSGRKSTSIKDADNDLKQEHDPTTAQYACVCCGVLWSDGQRIKALRDAQKDGGGWIAAKPFKGHASFHAPELASTFRRLRDIVQSYLDKLNAGDLQSFVNVSLGWPWEAGERADPDSLLARCVEYPADVPAGGLWLDCGVDMQMDRLEYEVVAWGEGEQSWSIEKGILWGDPLLDDVWIDLEDVLAKDFIHESGALMKIECTMVDTGGKGGMTAAAYSWLQGKTGRRIFGLKGIPGWGRPVAVKPTRKRTGKNASKYADLVQVGIDEAKLVVQRRLAIAIPGPGYCNFPISDTHNAEHSKQWTAERLVTRYVKGAAVREWHKNDRDRNEALDCRVYAYAGLKLMQPSFKRLAERLKMTEKPQNLPKKSPVPRETDKEQREIDPETPQEEAPPAAEENPRKRPGARRTLKKKGGSGGNWATKW